MSMSEQNYSIVKIPGLVRSSTVFCKFFINSFEYICASLIPYDSLFFCGKQNQCLNTLKKLLKFLRSPGKSLKNYIPTTNNEQSTRL